MNTTQEKNSLAKIKTSAVAEPALSVGLSEPPENFDFDANSFSENEEAICLFREYIINKNINIQSTEDLLMAAFQFHTKPDRMCDWTAINQGFKVDYGKKWFSLFNSKWCSYETLHINTEKDSVKIELLFLEDVEYFASHLGRSLKKYECDKSGAIHWSLERAWHYNHSSIEIDGKTIRPEGHKMFDFIDIGCWKQ